MVVIEIMLDEMLKIEGPLFIYLNQKNDLLFDYVMLIYTDKLTWLPVLIVFIFLCFYQTSKKQASFLVLVLVLVLTFSDQFSDAVVKDYFKRLRPSHHPDFNHLVHTVNGYLGGKYGFVSSHAANGFAFATFTHLVIQSRIFSFVVFCWAIVISYSRIYLGVHFISDVVFGALTGILIAFFTFKIYVLIRQCFVEKHLARKSFMSEKAVFYFSVFWFIYCFFVFFIAMLISALEDNL